MGNGVRPGPSEPPTFSKLELGGSTWNLILWDPTDVRFPLLHYPPSIRHYLRTLKPNPKPVVLVLTKTDLVPSWVAEAWKRYFEEEADLAMSAAAAAEMASAEGGGAMNKIEVVLMESYREKEMREETQSAGISRLQ